MAFPDNLPYILYYRVGKAVIPTLCRQPVKYISSSGVTNANVVCPTIPYGADAWRLRDTDPWQSFKDLPTAWLPYLNRVRGSEMDPRPAPRNKG